MSEITKQQLEYLQQHTTERYARLGFARLGAEAGSLVGSFGTILLIKKLMPEQMDSWKRVIAEKLVKPHLQDFEGFLDKFSGIEPDAKSHKREKMNDEQKADYIADLLVNFAILSSSGILFQAAGQGFADHMVELPPIRGGLMVQTSKLLGAVMIDKTIHMGAFLGLNSVFKKQNEEMQEGVSNVIQHMMHSKDNADLLATYATNWMIPNVVGMVGSVTMLDRVYKKEIAERLGEMGSAKKG